MSEDEFGVALAEKLHERIGEPVRFVHEHGEIVVGDKDQHADIQIENYWSIHEQGMAVEDIAAKIAAFWQDCANQKSLVWSEVRDLLVPHVTRAGIHGLETIVGGDISPALKALVAVDHPDHLRFVLVRDLSAMGVSEDVARATAALNMERILAERPGKEQESFYAKVPVVVFEGDLASDRAYALVRSLPEASAAFVAANFAVVARSVATNVIQDLAITARVALDHLSLDHPLVPVVHMFRDGKSVGAASAFEVREGEEPGTEAVQ